MQGFKEMKMIIKKYLKDFRVFVFSQYQKSFISLYALLLTLGISVTALHTMRTLSVKKDLTLGLYWQKQSMLYAQSMKEIALQCLQHYDLNSCKEDSVIFDKHFHGQYKITEITQDLESKESIQDSRNNIRPNIIKHHATAFKDSKHLAFLLDISIYANTQFSTHPLRYARRYILKG